ncbi:MAG: DNA/RNA nuclease SfsA [Spirochaetales bacterium]|nr:DNA/RNA nuclease SfsA [Spirochaetales bacterium]
MSLQEPVVNDGSFFASSAIKMILKRHSQLKKQIRVFIPDIRGQFLARPNRFIVEARTNTGIIRAHCPNPGRLLEILLPGTPLIFERNRSNRDRKTAYTLVAALHCGEVVPLDSQRTNSLVEELIIQQLYGKDAIVRREVTFWPGADPGRPETGFRSRGYSRFDFEVKSGNRTIAMEVKACTLCQHGVAMFPDAPSARGTRHIRHLTQIHRSGNQIDQAAVLFVIGRPRAKVFVPNIHTDPDFSTALSNTDATIYAVNVETDAKGFAAVENLCVPVDLSPVKLLEKNSGIYLLTVRLETPQIISTGAKGNIRYNQGFYIYVGSALQGLTHRIRRHMRKKKPLRWHIDYLTTRADSVKGFPIYTRSGLECELALAISRVIPHRVLGFGCSDCNCDSHLFFSEGDPLENRAFVETLLYFRHKRALGY